MLKYIALKQPSLFQEGCFDPVICLSLHKNYGIAFSISIPILVTLIISGIIITVLAVFVVRLLLDKSIYAASTGLILIGALGNFFDRIINGFTTDYIILFNVSAINIADILIVTGVFLTLWYNFNTDMKKR